MIELRRLSTILLGLAIGLVVVAIATSGWHCGGLFEGCKNYNRDAAMAVAALLIIGVACLAIVFILDLIGLCSNAFIVSPGYLTARFVLLYLGTAVMLCGILVFTGVLANKVWSYFAAVVGCVFAVQVAVLALISSRCVTVRSG